MNIAIHFFIALLFFSLCTSKAGINISIPAVIILSLFLFIKDRKNNSTEKTPKPIYISGIVFIIGCISAFFANIDASELIQFIKKGCFLLLPISIFYLFRRIKTKSVATKSILISYTIALLYALYNWYDLAGFQLTSVGVYRISSFFDYGRWTEILVYALSVLIPFTCLHKKTKSTRYGLWFMILVSTLCIIIDGGRAGFISLLISSLGFLLFNKTKETIIFAFVLILSLYTFKNNAQIKPTVDRFTSIINTKSDQSNLGRLVMWKHGLGMMGEKFQTRPINFWLGSGANGFKNDITAYVTKHSSIEEVQKQTGNNFSFSDSHNTFLDLATKYGVIYCLFYLMCLISFIHFFKKNIRKNKTWGYAGLLLIFNHIILGFFYTSGLEYQTVVLFCLLTLCASNVTEENHHA